MTVYVNDACGTDYCTLCQCAQNFQMLGFKFTVTGIGNFDSIIQTGKQ